MIRIKEGYQLCAVGADHVVVATALDYVNFSRVVTLNETAVELWKAVEGGPFDADTLTHLLTATYEVSAEQARTDVEAFIATLLQEGIAEQTASEPISESISK